MSRISESGKKAFTCGDRPMRAQLVTTAIALMASKASWRQERCR